jgi:hypothetical protein
VENEVVIHVRAEDETDPGFAKVRGKSKKLGEDVERDLKQAGQKAGLSLADGVERGLSQGRASTVRVADRIGDDVVDELETAGDRAGNRLGDGISDGLGQSAPGVIAEAKLIGEAVEHEMGAAGESGGEKLARGLKDGVQDASSGLGDGIAGALKSIASNPIVATALAAVGVAASGIIGGAIGAAIIGGGGALGIVGGFAAAAMDPRVQGASIALKDIVSDDLQEAAQSFVPAAVGAIDQVHAAWKRVLPAIESIFEQSGSLMDPLLGGILDGIDALVTGIKTSLSSAGPVFESLGGLFRHTFAGLGTMFADLSDNTEDIASTVDFLGDAVETTIIIITGFIEATTSVTGPLLRAAEATRHWLHELFDGVDAVDKISIEQGVWHDATEDATAAINDQAGALRALEQEMRKQTDPLFAVFDLQVKVRKAQEDYNAALEATGPNSAKTRKALLAMGQASFELTSALTTAANEGFNGKLTPAMRSALRNAGNTTKQINALEKELIQAWRAANQWSGTYTQTYHVVRTENRNYSGNSVTGARASGGITGAANGSTSSGLTMVGEAGPELVNLPPGTQVHSNPDTQRMMSGGGGMGGGGGGKLEIVLKFDPSHAPEAIRGMMEGIRAEVRGDGGSVQASLGVAGVA